MKKMLALLAIVVLFIGGCGTMNKREAVNKEEQYRVVEYFLSNYQLTSSEVIKKVEITQFEKDTFVGSWHITLKINDTYSIGLAEDKLGSDIRSSFYSPEEFKKKDKNVTTITEGILIKYLGDSHE